MMFGVFLLLILLRVEVMLVGGVEISLLLSALFLSSTIFSLALSSSLIIGSFLVLVFLLCLFILGIACLTRRALTMRVSGPGSVLPLSPVLLELVLGIVDLFQLFLSQGFMVRAGDSVGVPEDYQCPVAMLDLIPGGVWWQSKNIEVWCQVDHLISPFCLSQSRISSVLMCLGVVMVMTSGEWW